MDTKTKTTLYIFLVIAFLIGFIEASQLEFNTYDDELNKLITAHSWERDNGSDIETIYFTEEGEFGYYCACGNPVDNYDLCDSYSYDVQTQTIKLKCPPGVDITKIKVLDYSEYKLTLDFNGEKREFLTEYSHLIENPLPFVGEEFITPDKEELIIKFTKEGNFEAYNKTKKEYALGSDICFTWEYDKEKNEITLDCQDHSRTIKITKYTSNQDEEVYPTELELYFEHEDKTLYFIKTKDND